MFNKKRRLGFTKRAGRRTSAVFSPEKQIKRESKRKKVRESDRKRKGELSDEGARQIRL